MALRYLHARMAALRVLGPSSAWFFAAVARMSRASSSGDRGGSVLAVLCAGASTSQTGASLVLGRLAGMTNVGCTRHPSKNLSLSCCCLFVCGGVGFFPCMVVVDLTMSKYISPWHLSLLCSICTLTHSQQFATRSTNVGDLRLESSRPTLPPFGATAVGLTQSAPTAYPSWSKLRCTAHQLPS